MLLYCLSHALIAVWPCFVFTNHSAAISSQYPAWCQNLITARTRGAPIGLRGATGRRVGARKSWGGSNHPGKRRGISPLMTKSMLSSNRAVIVSQPTHTVMLGPTRSAYGTITPAKWLHNAPTTTKFKITKTFGNASSFYLFRVIPISPLERFNKIPSTNLRGKLINTFDFCNRGLVIIMIIIIHRRL